MSKILLLEDDLSLINGLSFAFRKQGFELAVVRTLKEANELWGEGKYDLLVLDVSLPDGTGYEFCKKVRQVSKVPIIFLTASDEEMNIIMGLDIGGDDYITTPFQPPLLLAHIAAVLKRAKKADVPEKMICKGVELDVVRGCVKCQEQQVDLSKNELKILHYLFLHQGEIVPRIELVEYLWDQQVFIDDNALSVNITRLRAKLAEIGVCDFIETKRGMGYRI